MDRNSSKGYNNLPQHRMSSTTRDVLKKRMREHEREYEDLRRKKSSYEKEQLAKLERERHRLEGERQRHFDRIQRERDMDKQMERGVDKWMDRDMSKRLERDMERRKERKSKHEKRSRDKKTESVVVAASATNGSSGSEGGGSSSRSRGGGVVIQQHAEIRDAVIVATDDKEKVPEPPMPPPLPPPLVKISDSPLSDHSPESILYLHPPQSKFDDDDEDEDDEEKENDEEADNIINSNPMENHIDDDYNDDDDDDNNNNNNNDHDHDMGEYNNNNNNNNNNLDDDGDDDDDDGNHDDETPNHESDENNLAIKNLPIYYPALQGCRNVEEFHCLNRIEEGTYGVVYRAIDMKTSEIVALKRLKMEKEKEGFPITSLREINTLLKAQHVNIVTVREIVVGCNMDKIYIVMDYIEHDLKSLMESMKEPFLVGEVKTLMIQLLRGVSHLHDNWVVHRDLKTSNLLLSHKGILKIGDFGLAREYGSPLKPYTPIVVTLWYRAPELLLGAKMYNTAIDMWSVGCIFAEFLLKKPLFPGKSEVDELNRIFRELGSPNEKIWPGVNELPVMQRCTFTEHPFNNLRRRFEKIISDQGFDLMNSLLTYNPDKRVTADEALKHNFFNEVPLPVEPSMFPTWPAKSELAKTRVHGNSPKPPSGGKAYAKLLGDDEALGLDTGFQLNASQNPAHPSKSGFTLKF